MKRKTIFIFFLLMISPLNVFALDNEIIISCNKTNLKNNEETECKITAKNLNFVTTSISGQIQVSNNLTITSSSYDKENWKILDSTFDVQDINLISENKNTNKNFTIATFKIKAINNNNNTGTIKFINVELGDEEYESHNINVNDLLLELKYDTKNEEIKDNPSTGDLNIIIPTIGTIMLLGYSIFVITKRKKYE